jgi:hypothetical protein
VGFFGGDLRVGKKWSEGFVATPGALLAAPRTKLDGDCWAEEVALAFS